jgi:hypothetical protein
MNCKRDLLVFVALAAAPLVQATPLCTDYAAISGGASTHSATLAQYVALSSGGCAMGEMVFSDFVYLYRPGSASNPNIPASNVTVTAEDNRFNPVLTFSANWLATNGNQVNLDIGYRVSVQPGGAPIIAGTTELAGSVTDLTVFDPSPQDQFAYVTAAEVLVEPRGRVDSLNPYLYPRIDLGLGSLEANSSYVFSDCSGHFNNPRFPHCSKTAVASAMSLMVFKDIFLNSGNNSSGGSADAALLTDVREALFQYEAPEPWTFLLFGGGLITMGIVGKVSRRGGEGQWKAD